MSLLPLRVNLARQPAENLRRAWVLWGGVLALLTALMLVLSIAALAGWWSARNVSRQISQVDRELGPLRRQDRQLSRQLDDPNVKRQLGRADAINSLIDRKAVSWTRLFEQLEKLMPPDLQLVSLRPAERNRENHEIVLVVASASLQPAIDFASRLEQGPQFSSARVDQEGFGSVAGQGPSQHRVQITVAYTPPVSDEAPSNPAPSVPGKAQAPETPTPPAVARRMSTPTRNTGFVPARPAGASSPSRSPYLATPGATMPGARMPGASAGRMPPSFPPPMGAPPLPGSRVSGAPTRLAPGPNASAPRPGGGER